MLVELRIENLAVIEHAVPQFGPGFNAITGETGAGKSVLLGALSLVLGNRGDLDLIRAGSERAVAAAVFQGFENVDLAVLDGLAIEREDVLVLSRELATTGRSVARINSAVAAVATLRDVGERLLEVHGQGSSSRWLREAEQRTGLDDFGGQKIAAARAKVSQLWDRRSLTQSELSRLRTLRAVERSELEQAGLDLAELDAASIRQGEDLDLARERERLLHVARLREGAARLHEAITGEAGETEGAVGEIATALQVSRAVRGVDPELDSAADQAEEVVTVLQELQLQLGSYLDHLPDDARRLDAVEERLALLERLARRYGGSLEGALGRQQQARALVGDRGGLDLELRRLEAEASELDHALALANGHLTELREVAAQRLQAAVTEDLRQMLMPHASFAIRLWQRDEDDGLQTPSGNRVECSRDGWDRVSFELAANSGDSRRPLADAASGGELARVALALLARISHSSGVGTVVFDEIDQGLGGEAANRVGELLRKVSERRQVICVTHLAPIAARADTHLTVVKSDEGGHARSRVQSVDGAARVDELARLLAGDATPGVARSHAAELLQSVGNR